MPKKQKKALYTRPSTNPHPSLSPIKSAAENHGSRNTGDDASVTECLNSLRSEDTRRLPLRSPPVATVHPSLRNLLDVPDTPQPRPRPGTRSLGPPHTRRIPGPAAPPSWELLTSARPQGSVASEHLGAPNDSAPVLLCDVLCDVISLPGAKCPPRGSLLHMSMRALVEQWDWHLQYDQFCLASLPLHLRQLLLTYIARYASSESLGKSHGTLRILFPDQKGFEAESVVHQMYMDDGDEVTRLDLGRALGTWLQTISSLKKEIIRPRAIGATGSRLEARHDISQVVPSEPPESWDDADAAPSDSVSQLSLTPPLQTSSAIRFTNLLHLSLSLSPSTASPALAASWPSLLSITSHLSVLQSLSLGYWPCPTLTPHAAAVSAKVRNPVSRALPGVSYSGTDMYTGSESNWREAAGILKRLSRHLYCLKWLDLTGCGAWFAALSWTDTEILGKCSGSEARVSQIGPDWNGSWRNVEYLGLGAGWTPPSLEQNEKSSMSSKLSVSDWSTSQNGSSTRNLGSEGGASSRGLVKQDWDVEEERRKYFAKKAFQRFEVIQATAREVASRLRTLRGRAKGKWIEVHL
jgi:hypothetical protein